MRYSDCKKKLILQCLAIIFISCSSPEKVQIDRLDGYWEIEFIYQDGEKFIPKVSKIIFDHYQIQYPKGYLNKVTLELNDSFNTSKDMTFFEIEKKNAKYYINYKSRWDEWKSKINFLDSQKLILEIGNRTFHYKRPKIKL
ncbi:MAG: hypothetical protein CBC28_00830 [Flavobacteriaceae bacterium TMED68]|nr:MAG: hypothetical protein CBC28_00830 [Flavobacteriaceae bacterium TMED68]|tara:strand:+ start:12527 stop:12949 length:423 start_codon:yes stop_codon:yes gene_type:complete